MLPSSLSGLILTAPEVWQDGFYQRTSLCELGLCFYIGHRHTPCPSAKPFQRILVVDLNGAHHVNAQFCECNETPGWVEHYRQLLRVAWYPTSFNQPRTVFTFDLLDTYHKLTLQGKLNLYDFYSSIMQKTNNYGKKTTVSLLGRSAIYHLTHTLPLAPLSPDLEMCSSVAPFEINEMWWWRSSSRGSRPCSRRGICAGMPGVPASRQKPTRRLETSSR